MLSYDGGKCAEPLDRGRFTALQPAQLLAEPFQLREPLGIGSVAFVGEVVSLARKPVNPRYRMAKTGRQEERRDGEIFVVADAHLLLCKIIYYQMVAS
jgi:hypothetical protein